MSDLQPTATFRDLLDAGLKILITHRLLAGRRAHGDLFSRGAYRPLSVRGARATHVMTFIRSHDGQHAISIAARLAAGMPNDSPGAERAGWWGDTSVELPEDAADRSWRAVLAGHEIRLSGPLPLSRALAHFPVELLLAD